MIKVQLIPILSDNYVFVIVDSETKDSFIVDPGVGAAVIDYLEQQDLQLKGILITHHHHDHIEGLLQIKDHFQVPVWGPLKNKDQIPGLDHLVVDGDQVVWKNKTSFQVLALPGHTLGHIAYYMKQENILFSGDVLFGLGCGRLFEGTFEQAFQSLQRVKSLPDETAVYCTHEYTESNLRFAKSLKPSLQSWPQKEFLDYTKTLLEKRAQSLPSVPLSLGLEKILNPFMTATSVEDFKIYRELRNQFR